MASLDEMAAFAAEKGFALQYLNEVFYLYFQKNKPAINPKNSLPVFYSLEEVEEFLNSPASKTPTNVVVGVGKKTE